MAHPTDGALYADLVDVCERYAARVFVIAQRRANAGQSRLFRLSNDLYLGTDPQSVLTSLRVLLLEYADDARVSDNVTSPNENWYVRRGHKYFLYEYELGLLAGSRQQKAFVRATPILLTRLGRSGKCYQQITIYYFRMTMMMIKQRRRRR